MLGALALLAAIAATPAEPAPPAVSVSVSEPRAFGYFLGDEIGRTVVVDAPPGMVLDAASLPQAGPLDYWLDLRSVAVDRNARTAGVEYRIALTYQTFYAPLDPRRLTIPGFTVKLSGGGRTQEERVPDFVFLTSPVRELFSDSKAEGAAVALQPDAAGALLPIARARTTLAAAAACVALSSLLLAWHYAWGPFRRRPSRPFTRAAHFLRVNAEHLAGEGGYRAALLKLHRAFDLAGGRRILRDDLAGFLAEHPEFAPLQPEIERLFASSREAFFANNVARARARMPLAVLAQLGARLGAAERSAA